MKSWVVGGALIRRPAGVLLVGNRRRDGRMEWTPPGGVIDDGESIRAGLARELTEETGLSVTRWGELRYRVVVEAPQLRWRLRVEAWEIVETAGELNVSDPDGIVEHVRCAPENEALALLDGSARWVREPVSCWISDPGSLAGSYRFLVRGTSRDEAAVERVE